MNTWRNREINMKLVRQYMSSKIMMMDIETTGLGKDARIIQFAGNLIDMKENLIVLTANIFINPLCHISNKIRKITNLTDEILQFKEPESVEIPHIIEYLKKADVLAGYNISFDIKMLENACKRIGIEMPQISYIDICDLARDFIPTEEIENYKLETVHRYINPDGQLCFHNAKDDVKATTDIFLWCIEQYVEHGKEEDNKLEKHIEYCYYWENPHRSSQKRIRIIFSKDKMDPQNKYIYWDCIHHCWSHSSDKKAKELFCSINKEKMEQQILEKYSWLNKPKNMDELSLKLKERKILYQKTN